MKTMRLCAVLLTLSGAAAPLAQQPAPGDAFETAARDVQQRLGDSLAELAALRETIAGEKIPLDRRLNELRSELFSVRSEFEKTTRLLDSRTLDLSNLQVEIKARKDETGYLAGLLGDYVRNFESRLHIAELQRYAEPLEAAKLAPENSNLSDQEVFLAQAELLGVSIDRLEEALGGARFEGSAVDANGIVEHGAFALIGPAALFRSDDGRVVGTAEQRLGSLEPTVFAFGDPADARAADDLVASGSGRFPLDPTLGNAHKLEAVDETFVEHVKKGGPVMVPIFAMAAIALVIALYKWVALSLLRKPSKRRVATLLQAVGRHDEQTVSREAAAIKGPTGEMLRTGVAHLHEPRELIEEVMYENVLTTRLKLQRLLPFIAICAASAPLLGLLGTVTGIINTFKMITVFGSGDVKSLSGGISEALITTKFGLIVAIPSLLLHAFLSRKARSVVGQMETTAIAFVNQISKTPFGHTPRNREEPPVAPTGGVHAEVPARLPAGDLGVEDGARDTVRTHVKEVLNDLLTPMVRANLDAARKRKASQPS